MVDTFDCRKSRDSLHVVRILERAENRSFFNFFQKNIDIIDYIVYNGIKNTKKGVVLMGIYENGVYNYNNSLKEETIYTNGNYDILAWKRQEISF